MIVFVVRDEPGLPCIGSTTAREGLAVRTDDELGIVYTDGETAHQAGWPNNPGDFRFAWVLDLWCAGCGSFPVDILRGGRPKPPGPPEPPLPELPKKKAKAERPETPSLFD